MKVSAFIATSLDGFIARTDGGIDWLNEIEPPHPSEDYGYAAFSSNVDVMVIGRHSLEVVMSFPQWPYENKKVIVLSRSLKSKPENINNKIEWYSGSLNTLIERLQHEGCQHLYVDGGKTIQSFINEDLLTDLTITTLPILLGEGIPLFSKTGRDIPLKHIKTQSYSNGLVQSTYAI